MKSIATKVDNVSTLPANAFNSMADEMENLVTQSGQTLDATPETAVDPSPVQITRAVTQAVHNAGAYVDSGTVNNYVLTRVGNWQQPTTYRDGSRYYFIATNSNSAACTVNVSAITVKSIVREDGTALVSGDIISGRAYTLTYNLAADKLFLASNVNPMTSVGDVIYGGVAGQPTRLAPHTAATRRFLRTTGSGSAGLAPVWDTVLKADVTDLQTLAAARFTPTIASNGANVSATPTLFSCMYSRVGNIVTYSGRVDVSVTAAANTASNFNLQIPIASNFASSADARGTFVVDAPGGTAYASGTVTADTVNDRLNFDWNATASGSRSLCFTVQYEVI